MNDYKREHARLACDIYALCIGYFDDQEKFVKSDVKLKVKVVDFSTVGFGFMSPYAFHTEKIGSFIFIISGEEYKLKAKIKRVQEANEESFNVGCEFYIENELEQRNVFKILEKVLVDDI